VGRPDPGAAQDDLQAPALDLTSRYRLVETYTTKPDAPGLSQYQVAFRETLSRAQETEQSAPKQTVIVRQARFTEAPAEVGPSDDRLVSAVVRRYEAAQVTPNPFEALSIPPLMKDLTLWYKEQPGSDLPSLVVLSQARPLYEHEYQFTANNPYTPNLSLLLPDPHLPPIHLLETWQPTARAIATLVGDSIEGGAVDARLSEIRPGSGGTSQVAIIDLVGEVTGRQKGEIALKAQIEFLFTPERPEKAGEEDQDADAPIVARGGISKVRLAQVSTIPGDRESGSPGSSIRRDLVLQRRWPVVGEPLTVPQAPPEPDRANSWITFVQPDGRYYLRYPQELRPDLLRREGREILSLLDVRPDGLSQLKFYFQPETQPKPDDVFRQALGRWREAGFQVQPTAPTRLPADSWPNVEVHRLEAVLIPRAEAGAPANRLHSDVYLLLFSRNSALVVEALTAQEGAASFRNQVEDILKTFTLGQPQAAKQ
jgi:hypothetical protein